MTCTINVYLKNGESYINKDAPEFPISEVNHIEFCFDGE